MYIAFWLKIVLQ